MNNILLVYNFITSYIDMELLIIILAGVSFALVFYVKELILKIVKVRNDNVKKENE